MHQIRGCANDSIDEIRRFQVFKIVIFEQNKKDH
jgi:hypothetical protein